MNSNQVGWNGGTSETWSPWEPRLDTTMLFRVTWLPLKAVNWMLSRLNVTALWLENLIWKHKHKNSTWENWNFYKEKDQKAYEAAKSTCNLKPTETTRESYRTPRNCHMHEGTNSRIWQWAQMSWKYKYAGRVDDKLRAASLINKWGSGELWGAEGGTDWENNSKWHMKKANRKCAEHKEISKQKHKENHD